MRIVFYLLIMVFAVRALPVKAQNPIPPPIEEFDDDEDVDEEDIDEPPAMRAPPMPTPFNQPNQNAGGVPGMPPITRPGAPTDNPFNNTRSGNSGGGTMGNAVGLMMANPSKVKFKVINGEFYVKGKKRGRDPVR